MDLNTNLENVTNMGVIKNATKSISINEAGIDNLAVETMKIAKLVNDYLNKIVEIVDETKTYYVSSSADSLRAKFEEIRYAIPTTVSNIENYAYSLKKVKINFTSQNEVVVNKLNRATLNVHDLIQKEGN